MNETIAKAIEAHGGLDRWRAVRSVSVVATISGTLAENKGFPDRLRDVTVVADVDQPRTTFRDYGAPGRVGVWTPSLVTVAGADGQVTDQRREPRASFAGHVRSTPWDDLHRLYFFGYAMWNYLLTPFLFAREGFSFVDLPHHIEDHDTWRVVQVTYPPDIPTHTGTQTFYFASTGEMRRIDYETEVAGGVASHYLYDGREYAGIVVPTRRRVVRRYPDGPRLSGPSTVFLDYSSVSILPR